MGREIDTDKAYLLTPEAFNIFKGMCIALGCPEVLNGIKVVEVNDTNGLTSKAGKPDLSPGDPVVLHGQFTTPSDGQCEWGEGDIVIYAKETLLCLKNNQGFSIGDSVKITIEKERK